MNLLAIDPGHSLSACVLIDTDTRQILSKSKTVNELMLSRIGYSGSYDTLVIEQIACMGMAVGAEVFETCVWTGRFIQAAVTGGHRWHRITRGDVKMHLCGNMRAKDPNIRQALIDRYGGSAAIGKKAKPGPLYGVTADIWAALAVGVTWADKHAPTADAGRQA